MKNERKNNMAIDLDENLNSNQGEKISNQYDQDLDDEIETEESEVVTEDTEGR